MKPHSFKFVLILTGLFLACSVARAAQYDIKTMTPEVQAALSNRQARYESLQQLKSQGTLGENNHGYVDVLNATPGASEIAGAENGDRRTIYQTITEQNNLGAAGVGVVETVFAEVHHEKSAPGQSIQTASGEWVQK